MIQGQWPTEGKKSTFHQGLLFGFIHGRIWAYTSSENGLTLLSLLTRLQDWMLLLQSVSCLLMSHYSLACCRDSCSTDVTWLQADLSLSIALHYYHGVYSNFSASFFGREKMLIICFWAWSISSESMFCRYLLSCSWNQSLIGFLTKQGISCLMWRLNFC